MEYKQMRKNRAKLELPNRNKFWIVNRFSLGHFYAKKATVYIYSSYKPIYSTNYLKNTHDLSIGISNDCKVEFDILNKILIENYNK